MVFLEEDFFSRRLSTVCIAPTRRSRSPPGRPPSIAATSSRERASSSACALRPLPVSESTLERASFAEGFALSSPRRLRPCSRRLR
jgi:hypothetical protein